MGGGGGTYLAFLFANFSTTLHLSSYYIFINVSSSYTNVVGLPDG